MRVLFGPVAVPNWYTIRPCTGQSSWPRSAVGMAAAVAAPRAPFGDVDQAALQNGALLGEGVLGEQQVDRGPVDLVRQRIDLAVQLVHDAIGRLLLPLDVRELVGERVHLGAQPLELLLDVGPLAADAFETLLGISELLIERLRPVQGE